MHLIKQCSLVVYQFPRVFIFVTSTQNKCRCLNVDDKRLCTNKSVISLLCSIDMHSRDITLLIALL